MDNKEYLNEEQYQKNSKKVNGVGTILLTVGVIMLLFGFIMSFGFHKLGFFIFAVIGLALVGFGAQAKLLGNGRNIQAYFAQQHIPVAQEGMEKMAPSMGKAAEEVAKGIKKGLYDDNKVFCKYCGAEIDSDSKFCNRCGKEL